MGLWKTGKHHYYRVRNRIFKIITLKQIFPKWYRWCARKNIEEDKIVFIEARYDKITNSFSFLYGKLEEEYNFKNKFCFLRTGMVRRKEYFFRCIDMIREIATAKCVFMDDASNIVSACPIREGTSVVQLWHGCGAFKGFGFSTSEKIFGENREEKIKFPYYKNYSFVTVSSPEVVWAYEEAMGLERSGEVRPLGISRTDVFFDKKFLSNALQRLLDAVPGVAGKKVLLYAPTFRGRTAKAKAPEELNIAMLKEALGDEYILLIKQHPLVKEPPPVPQECENFAFDVTETLSIDDLLCVADICISDYSSLIFEYSLFERPMLFFAYDLDEYFDWRGFYYPYDDTFLPGPIVKTTEGIIDYVRHPERINLDRVRKFKEKFMSSCDGHATDRILREALGDSLEKYKKQGVKP